MRLPAVFPLSEISKWEGCCFPQSITKNYAAVCALGLGELSQEECASVSSLPFPTQGVAVWSAGADSHWHDSNLRWPLLCTWDFSVVDLLVCFTDGKHLKSFILQFWNNLYLYLWVSRLYFPFLTFVLSDTMNCLVLLEEGLISRNCCKMRKTCCLV